MRARRIKRIRERKHKFINRVTILQVKGQSFSFFCSLPLRANTNKAHNDSHIESRTKEC